MRVPPWLTSRPFRRSLLLIGFALCAGRIFAPVSFPFSSGELVVRVTPNVPGGTVALELGPFGELTWDTHTAPLDVRASFVIGQRPRGLPGLAELRDLRIAFLIRKLPWLALAGALAGLLVADASGRRRRLLAGGIGAFTFLASATIVVGATIATFDADALREPHYRGPIEDAPRVLEVLGEVSRDLAGARRNINKVAEGLLRLHAQITSRPTTSSGPTTRMLVVSDVHNNPIGLLIARELADRFGARVTLNAGDFTDRGTEPEAELFARFGDVTPRQIVVGGNHEDRITLDRVRTLPGVTLLEAGRTDLVEIEGISVLGDTDPNAYGIASDPRNDLADAEIPARCDALAQRFLATDASIVVVHDRRLGLCAADAARTAGRTLVFVRGHDHKPLLSVEEGVLEISAGTSGANGIKTPAAAPYGFGLLEFDPATGDLLSACLFAFDDPAHLRESSCRIEPLAPPEETPPG
ncbi:MAG TPA: metallophosphoesterase [Actinomycetota bacterium]|nr:metallophosphoesterase [Actinomycetota bacterium]